MRLPDRLIEMGAWCLEHGHRVALKATGNRWPHRLMGMETVELHTTGRRSGQRRSTMLTAPIVDDDRVVVVASKGGHSQHPDWYLNLVNDPRVSLTVGGVERASLARTATAEEKAALWPRIISAYKGYDGYQRSTDRDIPVVICEPRSPD